jgi:hypothetical protein
MTHSGHRPDDGHLEIGDPAVFRRLYDQPLCDKLRNRRCWAIPHEVLSLCGSDPSVICWWSYDDVRNWRDRRLLR